MHIYFKYLFIFMVVVDVYGVAYMIDSVDFSFNLVIIV